MARRYGTGKTLQSARKHLIIKEIQAAVALELAARSEVPKTMPQRIADLLRELHRRLVMQVRRRWVRQSQPRQAMEAHRHAAQRDRAVTHECEHRWGDSARAGDWGSAVAVALVLSVATLIAAIAIAAFGHASRAVMAPRLNCRALRTAAGHWRWTAGRGSGSGHGQVSGRQPRSCWRVIPA